MSKIYIIGLGPGNIDSLTLGAIKRISSGDRNYVRTINHPTIAYFDQEGVEYDSFDYLYEEKEEFNQVYETICNTLIQEMDEFGTINYYVPGNPMVAEKSVALLIDRLPKDKYEIVAGLSFIEPILETINLDPIDGLKIVDGIGLKYTDIDINTNIIITQTYNRKIVSDIKLIISEVYGDEYMVYLIHGSGLENEIVEYRNISQLDWSENIGVLTSIYIPKVDKEKHKLYDYNDLINLTKTLRGEDGCPWDKEQDHRSIRQSLIEEAYELVEAIDEDDLDHIAEEVGDLLFQCVFHTEIAYENGEFYPIQVTSSLVNKLITRHPHVFFEKNVDNSKEVLYNWNKIKYENRNITSLAEKLKNIPKLPALMRSYKVQEKAAEIGFDWDNLEGPSQKILEEYHEILEVVNSNSLDHTKIEEEVGDLIFAVVNLSRFLNVNPEVALSKTIGKFTKRLEKMELKAQLMGIVMEGMTLEELDKLWDAVKEEE